MLDEKLDEWSVAVVGREHYLSVVRTRPELQLHRPKVRRERM